MEVSMFLKNRNFVNHLQGELVGRAIKRRIVMKINSENLMKNGEICFPANLLAWRDSIKQENNLENCSNILEYYLRRKKCETAGLSEQDILKKATESLIVASETWPMTIEKCLLRKDRVCVFLKRGKIIESAIKQAMRCGTDYGRRKSAGKSISFSVNEDKDSDLTTARLRLIKEVSQRVLALKGFEIVDNEADFAYSLTTKSQGSLEDDYRRCICGVVKNQDSNTKETVLTWSMYINGKIKELERLAEVKVPVSSDESHLKKIAQAVVNFELLSVKPSKSVFVRTNEDSDKGVSSSKGGSFVLYNTARINAILQRFEEEKNLGHYPSLPDIDKVDLSQLNQEDEWELAYNFIHGYPEMIEDCVRSEESLETSPQIICLFLSRLSQKFSVYHRRTRVLTEGRDHLVPTMMARLYLLRALQIVVNNSLAVLNIVPVRHM